MNEELLKALGRAYFDHVLTVHNLIQTIESLRKELAAKNAVAGVQEPTTSGQ